MTQKAEEEGSRLRRKAERTLMAEGRWKFRGT